MSLSSVIPIAMNHHLRTAAGVKVNSDVVVVVSVKTHAFQSRDIFELSQVIHKADEPRHGSHRPSEEEEEVFGEVEALFLMIRSSLCEDGSGRAIRASPRTRDSGRLV